MLLTTKRKLGLSPLGIFAMVSSILVVDTITCTSSLLCSLPLFGVPPEGIVKLSKCAVFFFSSGSFASCVEISSEDYGIAKLLSLFEFIFFCAICFLMGDVKLGSLTLLVLGVEGENEI